MAKTTNSKITSAKQHDDYRPHRCGLVGILGPANAGKSSLLNAILGKKISMVSPKAQSTRNRVRGILSRELSQIVFVDTPGILRKPDSGLLHSYLTRTVANVAADVDRALIVFDGASAQKHEQQLSSWLETILDSGSISSCDIVLNKIDAFPRDQLLPLIQTTATFFKERGFSDVDILPVSALTGDGVNELLDVIEPKLPLGPALFAEDTISDQDEKFFISEIIREKLYSLLHKEVPYSTAVRIERMEKLGKRLDINAVIIIERDSQKAIVIGKGGAVLKSVGIAARKELERLFGVHIRLELFVRVEKNWTHTERGLQRQGYGE